MLDLSVNKKYILKELQVIPGIGKTCAGDLYQLGIRKVSDLRNRNPMRLYKKLNNVTGMKNDICMLYVLRCAVYFASERRLQSEKLKWWYWKDKEYREA